MRRIAVLVLLAVFAAGAAAGWILEDALDGIHWPARDVPRHDRGETDPLSEDAEEDYLETLGLTRAQHDSIDELLDRREDRLESYWKTRLPDLQALIDSSRNDIRALLTTEQRAAYDRWLGTRPGLNEP
ncbi:MAG TPA: hypothetical protein VEB59_13270 [Gemmatimonadales bacterium]|nr:hypothetical protein [Gemmatimonadales bacterium]